MKLTNQLILPALCWTARLAAASTAHIYLHDPQSQPKTETTTLEPVAARLVLAQRAGVDDYHSSDLSREEVIDAINDYGVRTPLFADKKSSVKKAFILVEGVDSPEDVMPSLKSYTSFNLDPAPNTPASRGLFIDLAKQSDPKTFQDRSDDDAYDYIKNTIRPTTDGDLFLVTDSMSDFETLFTDYAAQQRWSISAIFVPKTESTSVGKEKFQWGTYQMPGAQSPLRKRQQSELPLTETSEFRPVESFTAPISSFDANNTEPLRGILPACFTTQSACESATRNCTGHGSCFRKYHDSTAKKGQGLDCFVCGCKATQSADGKKTTNWGGPACQKKDISVQFWLIVLFTVGLVFLIGFAVGTIWDMGSQELPSVIGAGVSGPSARK